MGIPEVKARGLSKSGPSRGKKKKNNDDTSATKWSDWLAEKWYWVVGGVLGLVGLKYLMNPKGFARQDNSGSAVTTAAWITTILAVPIGIAGFFFGYPYIKNMLSKVPEEEPRKSNRRSRSKRSKSDNEEPADRAIQPPPAQVPAMPYPVMPAQAQSNTTI